MATLAAWVMDNDTRTFAKWFPRNTGSGPTAKRAHKIGFAAVAGNTGSAATNFDTPNTNAKTFKLALEVKQTIGVSGWGTGDNGTLEPTDAIFGSIWENQGATPAGDDDVAEFLMGFDTEADRDAVHSILTSAENTIVTWTGDSYNDANHSSSTSARKARVKTGSAFAASDGNWTFTKETDGGTYTIVGKTTEIRTVTLLYNAILTQALRP